MLLLKQLTRDRVSIVEHTTRLKNRLHALEHSHNPSKQVLKRLKAQIRLYDRQRKEVELQIEEAIETDELLQERIEKISQVKGLGIVTIATVVAETDGFNLFTSKSQLVSYCGYDVVQEESGTSVKKKGRISKKGNKYIRRALYFPSVTTIQYEKNFTQLYERVYERTGMKMKGLVAVQRKLLILIYTLFKKNENYNSEHTLEAAPIEMQNADSAPIL
jgi:transposase